ncbi:MAG TPA: NAD(P)-dependent oxidoreductase [Thermohalobaculum sp.]|nr:NAD(P)-dependent oxidoreductase [Thermohalobaculum sp.]
MKLLITGAAGKIGRVLRRGLAGSYDFTRLADIAPQDAAGVGEECIDLDIGDLAATVAAVEGIDCVIHLAGVSVEPEDNAWAQVLPTNIVGTYNVFEAARLAGVKRVVFASSNHVVGFHRREVVTDCSAVARPDSYYGVSKVFGEALGRLYADKHGLSVACLRIGSFREYPEDPRMLATWISARDGVQLFRRCIDAPDFHFLIAYGISDNASSFWSNSGIEWLGYRPEDTAETYASDFAGMTEDAVIRQFHGGSYCEMNFTGDPSRIE